MEKNSGNINNGVAVLREGEHQKGAEQKGGRKPEAGKGGKEGGKEGIEKKLDEKKLKQFANLVLVATFVEHVLHDTAFIVAKRNWQVVPKSVLLDYMLSGEDENLGLCDSQTLEWSDTGNRDTGHLQLSRTTTQDPRNTDGGNPDTADLCTAANDAHQRMSAGRPKAIIQLKVPMAITLDFKMIMLDLISTSTHHDGFLYLGFM
jgi:hypothetical protein